MLILDEKHRREIAEHGERDYPHECCGLLIGKFDEMSMSTKRVIETYPISNAREETAKRNRFLIRPEEFMRGERYAREHKLDVVGVYHSHPDHPARPSQYDLDHALPVYSYVIVSVRERRADELLSWELETDRSRFNPETIIEETVGDGSSL